MLDHRPIRLVSEIESQWPCQPVIPGNWTDVPSNISAAIAAEGARREDPGQTFPSPIERMRSLALDFYPGCFLVEGLARYTIDSSGVFRMLAGPDDLLLLDGASPPIHEFNTRRLRLESDAQADQYLRFFCAMVHGDAGPFTIAESMETLALNPALGPVELARVAAAIRPISRADNDGADMRSAAVIYGTALFRSRFRIRHTGMVEMIEDDVVEPDMLEHASRHDGIWEIFEDPAPGADGASR